MSIAIKIKKVQERLDDLSDKITKQKEKLQADLSEAQRQKEQQKLFELIREHKEMIVIIKQLRSGEDCAVPGMKKASKKKASKKSTKKSSKKSAKKTSRKSKNSALDGGKKKRKSKKSARPTKRSKRSRRM